MKAGTTADLRIPCPVCGQMTLVNADGRFRYHRAVQGPGWHCKGSRVPYMAGAVIVRKLKDGVVIKVRHASGTFGDDEIWDELVLLAAEWDELVRIARGRRR